MPKIIITGDILTSSIPHCVAENLRGLVLDVCEPIHFLYLGCEPEELKYPDAFPVSFLKAVNALKSMNRTYGAEWLERQNDMLPKGSSGGIIFINRRYCKII